MYKYIKEKIQNFLFKLLNSEKFKQMLWDLLILIIETVRDDDRKTKTGS